MIDVLNALLEVTLYSSILILGVVTVKAAFHNKISKRLISALWLLVLLRLAIPVTLNSPIHLDKLFLKEQPATTVSVNALDDTQSAAVTAPNAIRSFDMQSFNNKPASNDGQVYTEANGTPNLANRMKSFVNRIDLYILAFYIWLGGAMAVLVINGFQMAAFGFHIKKCVASRDVHVREALRSAGMMIGQKRDIAVAESIHVPVPMVYGLVQHKIILPVNLKNSISRDKLILILLHELCHVRRRDTAVNSLWLLGKAIYWFNPLVWIAYRSHLTDMELACDEMVADHLSNSGRLNYSQGLIDIVRLSNGANATPAYMAFCDNKKKLKKRVQNMMIPVKNTKRTAIATVVFVIMLIIGCFTTACQPTPENEIVVGKNNDNLDNIIESTPAPTIDTETIQQSQIWQEQLSGKNVVVNIDAEIEFPAVSQLPVVEVEPVIYTEDDAWKAIQVLFQNSTVYDEPLFTKELLEAQIITLKQMLSEIENGTMPDYEDGDEDQINDQVEYYTELLQTAPSEADESQALTNLSFKEQNGRDVINVSANIGNNGYPAKLMITRNASEYNSGIYFSNRPDDITTTPITENNMEMTLDEAVSLAQSTMSELGIEDMILAESSIEGSTKGQGYVLNFIKSVNGIGISDYQTHMMTQQEGEASVYAPFLNPEQVIIYINDTGILKFVLTNALEIGDVINENVDILSIDEVKDIFRNQVFYNYYGDEDNPLTINIERIELGYFIQSVKDQQGVFRAIPVWDFLASEQAYEGDTYTYSVLTINAIDGSIIDRNLGY